MSLLLLFNQPAPEPSALVGKPRSSSAALFFPRPEVVDLADSDEDALVLILAAL